MKKVPTVDIYPTKPSGPLFRFITEEYFVSGVRVQDLENNK
jgi:sorbitol-specific phosphotransferase system component IIBC